MRNVDELVGVYDADSGVIGELSYWVKARFGNAHCALCDITHGSVRERPEWKQRRAALRVPVTTHHRNDQPAELAAVTRGNLPVVAARVDNGYVLLLGPTDIAECDGSPEKLVDAIRAAAERLNVAL
ncbi:MAG: hypothetical protein QOJ00_2796 [Actinomycetota bacterium]|jgi:hypothetical protein